MNPKAEMDRRGETLEVPHPNSYVLSGVRLIAAEYPFTPDPATARAKLCRRINAGATTCCAGIPKIPRRRSGSAPLSAHGPRRTAREHH
jgi:hypothetical protein